MWLRNRVAIARFCLIAHCPPIRPELLLAFANLAECLVSSRSWQGGVHYMSMSSINADSLLLLGFGLLLCCMCFAPCFLGSERLLHTQLITLLYFVAHVSYSQQ
jgi:hypothetical protein